MAKLLHIFEVNIREDSGSWDYVIMQNMELMLLKDTVDKTLGCVCFRRSTDEEVGHSWGHGSGPFEHRQIKAGDRFGMESLQTMQACVNVFR